MLAFTAWSLVIISLLQMGFFGYKSVNRSKILMFLIAFITAFVLNVVASQLFMAYQVELFRKFDKISEKQLQPDMPNLLVGVIMFGWVFYLVGYLVGNTLKSSEQKSS